MPSKSKNIAKTLFKITLFASSQPCRKSNPQTSHFGQVFGTNFDPRSKKSRFEIGLKMHTIFDQIQERSAQMPSTPDTHKVTPCKVTPLFYWRRAFIENAREARRPKGPSGPWGSRGIGPLGTQGHFGPMFTSKGSSFWLKDGI